MPEASKVGTLTWVKFLCSEDVGFESPLSTAAEPGGRQMVSDALLSVQTIWRIVIVGVYYPFLCSRDV